MCDSLNMDTRGEKTGRKAKDDLEKDSRLLKEHLRME